MLIKEHPEPHSLSYQGEDVTKSSEKRHDQKVKIFILHSTTYQLRINFPTLTTPDFPETV